MKHNRHHKPAEFIDSDFAEALYEENCNRRSCDRQAMRKTQQFCRQVQRALNLALTDRNAEDGLSDLFVDEVTPAPDCGHLLVHVAIPTSCTIQEVISALRQAAPHLRSEVASATSRKRAPELLFVPAILDGGEDD